MYHTKAYLKLSTVSHIMEFAIFSIVSDFVWQDSSGDVNTYFEQP